MTISGPRSEGRILPRVWAVARARGKQAQAWAQGIVATP
jgi:hypothetical protein